MELVEKLYSSDGYKQQQQAAIQQVLDGMKAGATAPDTTQQPAPTTDTQAQAPSASTLDASKIADLKKGTFVEGKANARITIFEYSEMLCPYCKRQNDNKVMEELLKKYPNDVNVVFKHYIVHPGAEKLAEAAQCVGELAGVKPFYSFIEKVFDLDDKSDTAVLGVAKGLGVKESAFTQCLNQGKYASFVSATTEEGRTLFGVNGTPGNVIVDNQKGTFTLIAGAYPVEEFEKTIDAILK
ncbi:MAG: DsbA family protein [bacterium]